MGLWLVGWVTNKIIEFEFGFVGGSSPGFNKHIFWLSWHRLRDGM